MTPQPYRRRGVILIALMVFLAVAMLIVISWLKLAGAERRMLRTLQAQAQAEWLAESAIHRAAAQLSVDPAYRKEVWKLTPADIGSSDAAEVAIRVEPVDGQASLKRITVQADHPADPTRRNRRTKTIHISIPAEGGSS